ncbi:MAG: TdeIII family type II restriction endonuclease [Zoogloeaceae bacterium]|nr:TdeIII family type II restriction endonuclease [Zoogloeaceae bacterium]
MPLTNIIKEKISVEVIKTLVTRFESFPEDASNNRNAPFHEAFLNAFADKLEGKVSDTPFFISLSSWLQGLNTTLGQSFFENVAHHLCDGEKREYTSKKLGNLKITQEQKSAANDIITNLSNSKNCPNLNDENKKLFRNGYSSLVNAIDFSADVFYESDDSAIAIELKSVKPNSGEMRGEKQKILEGKAALYREFPSKKIYFYIGFPFDPTVNPLDEVTTGYDKSRFLKSIINMDKFFSHEETLVASELWNFLSGEKNTMEEIIAIINTISTTKFQDKLQLLAKNSKRNTSEYIAQLQEWNLFSEKKLIENDDVIRQQIANNGSLTRIYNKNALDSKGNYNWQRYRDLEKLIC